MTDFAILVLASYLDCMRLAVSIIIPYPSFHLPAFSPKHDPNPRGKGCRISCGGKGERVRLFSHLYEKSTVNFCTTSTSLGGIW